MRINAGNSARLQWIHLRHSGKAGADAGTPNSDGNDGAGCLLATSQRTDEQARTWWAQRGSVIRAERSESEQPSPDTLLIDLGRHR